MLVSKFYNQIKIKIIWYDVIVNNNFECPSFFNSYSYYQTMHLVPALFAFKVVVACCLLFKVKFRVLHLRQQFLGLLLGSCQLASQVVCILHCLVQLKDTV